ncbi:hypothetical protein [Chryseobacterium herbae]|uniref:Uncharacterized protein n=1 Tax=Chryseobacterium herbae TaxID=2976476 RepID=A0ABT2IXQ2_9FLAO|nr:hypothetical protein [Chryseobacterium sp. pc1-10]MCT2563624.1 hypothetical protein [Chryseobacterium sp. pc1-10]
MIQFILMLIGLAFSNNNANTATNNNDQPIPVTMQTSSDGDGVNPGGSEGDTSGETGQIPPPKK